MFGLDSLLGGIGDIAGYFAGRGIATRRCAIWRSRARAGKTSIPTSPLRKQGGRTSTTREPDRPLPRTTSFPSSGTSTIPGASMLWTGRGSPRSTRAPRRPAESASEAAKDDAARRGMLNSASTLVAQQTAGQNAAQVGSNQGIQAAGMAEGARRAAMNQAGWMAGQMRSQDYEKAQAQDAIARFNASQRQGAAVSTLQGKLARQGGISDVYGQQYGAKNAAADRTGRLYGGIGRMAGGVANYFANPAGGAGTPASGAAMFDDPEGLAMAGAAL
jgi:hypothetical protein